MKFSIDTKKLKSMGFTYHCKNYKCYHKQYGNISLFLNVKDRDLQVNNWNEYTKDIIDFIRSNYDKWLKYELPQTMSNDGAYIPILLNYETGNILIETSKVLIDKYQNPHKYKDYNSILIKKNDFDLFFEDIKKIV